MLTVLAQSTSTSDFVTYLNLGVLGMLALAAIRGLVWFQPAVARLQKDLDAVRGENGNLNTFLREVAVPAITTAADTVRAATETAQETAEHAEDVTRALKDVQRTLGRVLDEMRRRSP